MFQCITETPLDPLSDTSNFHEWLNMVEALRKLRGLLQQGIWWVESTHPFQLQQAVALEREVEQKQRNGVTEINPPRKEGIWTMSGQLDGLEDSIDHAAKME